MVQQQDGVLPSLEQVFGAGSPVPQSTAQCQGAFPGAGQESRTGMCQPFLLCILALAEVQWGLW